MEITLEPSDTEKIVMVPIVNDDVQEPQESFLVRLRVTQTRVQLARDSSTITVTDDDSKCTTVSSYVLQECVLLASFPGSTLQLFALLSYCKRRKL